MGHLALVTITFLAIWHVVVPTTCPAQKRKRYVVSNQKVTFHEAYLRCRQYGLEPAEINSQEEHEAVEQVLKFESDLGWVLGYWLSGTNLGNKNSYYWLHSGRPMFYSLFAPGQPDNAGNKENCLHVFQTTRGRWAWNDAPCDSLMRFVCQCTKQNAQLNQTDNNSDPWRAIDVRLAADLQ
ncbi:salivary C-type lectin 2-like [Rhynchophorus ferrugineus]|uniref:salivary C-type lectin 2-like n=1 Tax=Rhynchophorus ferrugineus TaxID=354439 RepID=UPI003FCD1C5B